MDWLISGLTCAHIPFPLATSKNRKRNGSGQGMGDGARTLQLLSTVETGSWTIVSLALTAVPFARMALMAIVTPGKVTSVPPARERKKKRVWPDGERSVQGNSIVGNSFVGCLMVEFPTYRSSCIHFLFHYAMVTGDRCFRVMSGGPIRNQAKGMLEVCTRG